MRVTTLTVLLLLNLHVVVASPNKAMPSVSNSNISDGQPVQINSEIDDGGGSGGGYVGTCQHLNHTTYGPWESYYEPRYEGWGEATCLVLVGSGEWRVLGSITRSAISNTPAGAIAAGISFAASYYAGKACDRIDKRGLGADKFMKYIGDRRLAIRWVGYYDSYLGRCSTQEGARWWDWK